MPRRTLGTNDSLFPHLTYMNNYYINNVPHGMLVQCDKCDKWRLVEEYQEVCEVPEVFFCSMWNLGDGERGNCYIPQMHDETKDFTNERYTPGSLVWAKMIGYPWWPAMVEDEPRYGPDNMQYCQDLEEDPKYHVVFFGDKTSRAWIKEKQTKPFSMPILFQNRVKGNLDLRIAIEEAAEATNMDKDVRLQTFSFAVRFNRETSKLGNQRTLSQGRLRNAHQGASFGRRGKNSRAAGTKRKNNLKSESTPKKTRHSEESSLEQSSEQEISQEDTIYSVSNGKNSQNDEVSNHSASVLHDQSTGKKIDSSIVDENNNDKYLDKGNSSEDVSGTEHLSVQLQCSAGSSDSNSEDEERSVEHKLFVELLDKEYPPFEPFKCSNSVSNAFTDSDSADERLSEAHRLFAEFIDRKYPPAF